jgi:glycosyltransferase involved in cell wall biosynthesis
MTVEVPVTVVIPAFNRRDQIVQAIGSVHAQRTCRPAEILVVDDHSSDDTGEVARSLGARVIRHNENRGPSAARNTGFEHARQPWLAQLDSDDLWLPECLALLWDARADHELITAASLHTTAEGVGGDYHGVPGEAPLILTSPVRLMWPCNFVSTSSVLMRRETVLGVGGYDINLWYGEDLDLWLRLLERGTGVALPVVASHYIAHEQQAVRAADRWAEIHTAPMRVLLKYSDRPWWRQRDYETYGSWPIRGESEVCWKSCVGAPANGTAARNCWGDASRVVRRLDREPHLRLLSRSTLPSANEESAACPVRTSAIATTATDLRAVDDRVHGRAVVTDVQSSNVPWTKA